MSKRRKKFFLLGGFTLVEMLLVIAIIGILAGMVYAMIGNSDNSKRKAVLTTAKSIMPYAQECMFKGNNLLGPPNSQTGGGSLCSGSETSWPAIGIEGCVYSSDIGNEKYSIDCSDVIGSPKRICCDAKNGTCKEEDSCQ